MLNMVHLQQQLGASGSHTTLNIARQTCTQSIGGGGMQFNGGGGMQTVNHTQDQPSTRQCLGHIV
jgi:hypothetical protein